MSKQKRHNIKFKTPKRYRLSLYNENSLNRIWTVKMGRKRLILLIVVSVLAVFCAGMMIISFTPLRTFLPGYLSNSERSRLARVDARADSLARRLALYDGYLSNINAVFTGDMAPDSMMTVTEMPVDSLAQAADSVTLIGRGAAESEFVKMYGQRSGFVLDDRQDILADAPLFVAPVKDAMVSAGSNPAVPVIEITEPAASVHSINRGTVVEQYRSGDGSYVIVIQHPDGYLSRYSGITRAFAKAGDRVDADSRIGQYVKSGKAAFGFELRRDGQSLNPMEYVPF